MPVAEQKEENKIAYDSLTTFQTLTTQRASYTSAAVAMLGPLPRTGVYIAVDVSAIEGAAQFGVNFAQDGVGFDVQTYLQNANGGWVSAPGLYYIFVGGLWQPSVPNPGGVYNPSLQLFMNLAAGGSGSSSSQSLGSSSSSPSSLLSSSSGGSTPEQYVTYQAFLSLCAS